MKIKVLIFLRISFLCLSFSLAPGNSHADSKIVVAGDKNFPPVEYLQDNHPKGFNVELWQELSKAMGRTLEIELMPWKDAQKKVLDGEADALTLLGPTKQRRKLYDFSEPWLEFKFVFFVRSDDLTIKNINDLKRRIVGVTEGGYPRQVLESNKNIKLLFIRNNLEGFQLLQSNKISAVATDQWVGSYTIQKHDIDGVRIVEEPFATNVACIPVKKGNVKLLKDINLGIMKLRKDGTINEILDKWSPKRVVFLTEEKIRRTIIIVAVVLLIAVIVFSLLWIVLLKRQVNRKTKQLRQEIGERKQVEETLRGKTKELSERVKDLNCLYDISKLVESPDISIEEIIQGTAELIPPAWQYPDITCCRIIFKEAQYSTENFQETNWKQSRDIFVHGEREGTLDVCYLEERPEIAEGPFVKEERELINAIGERLGRVFQHKLLQDQLIRSERLTATGQLAASIAHEINSPLQGITSLLNSIERTHSQDERLLKNLGLVKGGFIGIRDIVRKLLDLNRPGKEKKQPMNINSVIEDTVTLLKSHLKKTKVKIIPNLSSKIPNITASPQQLGQVFMNLINNAVEAMTGTSKSVDSWEPGKFTDREITINSNLMKNNIIIEVADTGPGISKEDTEHIFDPFYTRKKEMGMGIGLSLCHGIIEDHNGSIATTNSSEGGAVFTITLPII